MNGKDSFNLINIFLKYGLIVFVGSAVIGIVMVLASI